MIEIVALQVNGTIYGGFHALTIAKLNDNNFDRYVTKQEAKLMSCLDLGHNWEKLAQCPVILILDDNRARLPDGYYTNVKQEIFAVKDGIKNIIPNAAIEEPKNDQT